MTNPPPKPEVDFNEALRRIANTPKQVVEDVAKNRRDDYNGKEAAKKPPPSVKRK